MEELTSRKAYAPDMAAKIEEMGATSVSIANRWMMGWPARVVEWHMREAWRELMFADPDQEAKITRAPVAPAKRSKAALAKVLRHTFDDGTPAHSFRTLMAELATIVRNTCRTPSAGLDAPTFDVFTTFNPNQARTLELQKTIHV